MSQPYPDPPMTSDLIYGKTKVMHIVWSKWIQGLKTVVNRLSGGLGVNITVPIAPVSPATIPGSMTIRDGVVTSITPPT